MLQADSLLEPTACSRASCAIGPACTSSYTPQPSPPHRRNQTQQDVLSSYGLSRMECPNGQLPRRALESHARLIGLLFRQDKSDLEPRPRIGRNLCYEKTGYTTLGPVKVHLPVAGFFWLMTRQLDHSVVKKMPAAYPTLSLTHAIKHGAKMAKVPRV